MRIKANSFFLIAIILLMLFAIGLSLSFRHFEAKVLPLLISIAIVILAGLELTKGLRAKHKTLEKAQAEPRDEHNTWIELRRFSATLGWVVSVSLAAYVLGFLITIPLFILSYFNLNIRGRGQLKSRLISIVFAAIVTATIYGIFELALKVPLYKGLLFGG